MNRNLILTIFMIVSVSFLVGCGGSGSSSNPVSTNISADSQAQGDANFVRACIAPVTKRKFNFNKSAYKVAQTVRAGLKTLAAKIRLAFLSDSNTEDIQLVINSVMIKSNTNQKYTFKEEGTVSLSGNSISQFLAEKELPEGVYNYFEFSVKSAKITEGSETFEIKVPTEKIRFTGNFELKNGFATTLKIDFAHKLVKTLLYHEYEKADTLGKIAVRLLMKAAWGNHVYKYTLVPTVTFSSELTPLEPEEPEVKDGDVTGTIANLINADKLANITVTLEGTEFSTTTDANGAFTFNTVPAGKYTLKATNNDYLDASYQVEVIAGQVSNIEMQMNPAVVESTTGNTGWFSEYFPLADINAAYGETSMETPVRIDFVSMAFTKATLEFTAEYHGNGSARFCAFLGNEQQVSADSQIGDWWAGNYCKAQNGLGEFLAISGSGNKYVIDITEELKAYPSNIYYVAARNLDIVDIRLSNIKIKVYYK